MAEELFLGMKTQPVAGNREDITTSEGCTTTNSTNSSRERVSYYTAAHLKVLVKKFKWNFTSVAVSHEQE